MGGDGVSDISAGADEGVGGVVNGAGLASGSIARSGASGGGSTVGAETRFTSICLSDAHPWAGRHSRQS